MSLRDPNSIILFGGTSDEARVSVASAQNLARTLVGARLWFWALDGAVHEIDRPELETHADAFTKDFVPAGDSRYPDLDSAFAELRADQVVFLAVHGGEGENGGVQRRLEAGRAAFTGSDAGASARAFDKNEAKRIVAAKGIRVAVGTSLNPELGDCSETLKTLLEKHRDLILKPVAGGSSIGLFRLKAETDISAVVPELKKKKVLYLAEPFLTGREFTVGVADLGHGAKALPPSEVRLEAGANFDYEGKYLGRHSTEITPAQIPDSLTTSLQEVALKSHEALGCFGYSRTDLIVTPEGQVYFIELNTLPGLTGASFIPQQLQAAGVPFEAFVSAQLSQARGRRASSTRRAG
ncbi:MAG: ATP-grasp domain-containing protein [Bdellovibrionota bacterium]